MNISNVGINLIKSYEKLRLKKYLDSGGNWTVGWGHKIRQGEKLDEITEEQAEKIFMEDIKELENNINKLIKVNLSQLMYDAIGSLVFNIGIGNFKTSTILKLLNEGRFLQASKEFTRWVYCNKVILEGLIRRRTEELILYLLGWMGER